MRELEALERESQDEADADREPLFPSLWEAAQQQFAYRQQSYLAEQELHDRLRRKSR
jgi:hypothetical protein